MQVKFNHSSALFVRQYCITPQDTDADNSGKKATRVNERLTTESSKKTNLVVLHLLL